jgi:thioredoxin-dependent peroxiredoxin
MNPFDMKWISLFIVAAIVIGAGWFWPAKASALSLGSPVPAVSAVAQDNSTVSFPEQAKGGYLLVYFYPKAMTPGCTAQACSLRDAYSKLADRGVKVLGVSTDSVDKQSEFKTKQHLPFTLISDTDHHVTKAFGVPLMMNNFASRQAYLFKDGKLIWVDTHAATDKQAADVLAVLDGKKAPGG